MQATIHLPWVFKDTITDMSHLNMLLYEGSRTDLEKHVLAHKNSLPSKKVESVCYKSNNFAQKHQLLFTLQAFKKCLPSHTYTHTLLLTHTRTHTHRGTHKHVHMCMDTNSHILHTHTQTNTHKPFYLWQAMKEESFAWPPYHGVTTKQGHKISQGSKTAGHNGITSISKP